MFAPQGYALFTELSDRIYALAAEAYPFRGALNVVEASHKQQKGRFDALGEFAQTCASLSVASPSGTVLRISPAILNFRRLSNFGSVFVFIDPDTGLVDTKKADELAQYASSQLGRIQGLAEGEPHHESVFEPDLGDLYGLERDGLYVRPFSNFDGWSVVFRLEDMPDAITYFECFRDAYGMSDPTAPTSKQVVDILVGMVDAGDRPKRETFRKTFCSSMKRDEFRAIWAEAAEKRPELSVPGPKRLIKNQI